MPSPMPHTAWNTYHCGGGGSTGISNCLVNGRTEPSQNTKLFTAVCRLQNRNVAARTRLPDIVDVTPMPAQAFLKSVLPSANTWPPIVSPNAIVFDVPSVMSVTRVCEFTPN